MAISGLLSGMEQLKFIWEDLGCYRNHEATANATPPTRVMPDRATETIIYARFVRVTLRKSCEISELLFESA
jgi:hypothetical protein